MGIETIPARDAVTWTRGRVPGCVGEMPLSQTDAVPGCWDRSSKLGHSSTSWSGHLPQREDGDWSPMGVRFESWQESVGETSAQVRRVEEHQRCSASWLASAMPSLASFGRSPP